MKAQAGVSIVDLDDTMHRVIKEGGQGDHVFGPPIHGVGIDFEESPLPPGHAFFHGGKGAAPSWGRRRHSDRELRHLCGSVGGSHRGHRAGRQRGTRCVNRLPVFPGAYVNVVCVDNVQAFAFAKHECQ